MSKAEFAVHIGVHKSNISHYLRDGKITAAALSGSGRTARIIVEQAKADLARTLDPSQSFGLNGMATRAALRPAAASSAALGAAPPTVPIITDTAEKIAREKLRQAEFQTRQMERDEALEVGRYVLADDYAAKVAATASLVLSTVETGLLPMADDVMALIASARESGTDLTARDVFIAMQKSFRTIRENAARGFAERNAKIKQAEREALAVLAAEQDESAEADDELFLSPVVRDGARASAAALEREPA